MGGEDTDVHWRAGPHREEVAGETYQVVRDGGVCSALSQQEHQEI